jgi:hypothetical protein
MEEQVHFWRCKLVKDGPWIGVRTFLAPPLIDGEYLDRSPRFQALVRNETTGRMILYGEPCPIEVHGIGLRNIERITEADYRFLVDHSAYATAHAPHMPDAAPKMAINFMTMKPPF